MGLFEVVIVGGFLMYLRKVAKDDQKKQSQKRVDDDFNENIYHRSSYGTYRRPEDNVFHRFSYGTYRRPEDISKWFTTRRDNIDKRISWISKDERELVPCYFNDGLTREEFVEIAKQAKKGIGRIKSIKVRGETISCNVDSITGYSDWDFSVDFNNWGHITGTFWHISDNADSNIPVHYGRVVRRMIKEKQRENNISIINYANYVDDDFNKDLKRGYQLKYTYEEFYGDKSSLRKPLQIVIDFGTSDLIGQHLHPVLAIIRKNNFKNIACVPIGDWTPESDKYLYEVEQVLIGGNTFFEMGMGYTETTEVIITFHYKLLIPMPFSESELKGMDFKEAKEKLLEHGYVNIETIGKGDLKNEWFTSSGSVESVLSNSNTGTHIKKDELIQYDSKIQIVYHSLSSKKYF